MFILLLNSPESTDLKVKKYSIFVFILTSLPIITSILNNKTTMKQPKETKA